MNPLTTRNILYTDRVLSADEMSTTDIHQEVGLPKINDNQMGNGQ